MSSLLKIFDLINLYEISKPSDFIELLLSGDVELNPGPGNSEINGAKLPSKLENKRNVCFTNASFQLLSVIPEFIEYVKNNICHSPLDEGLKDIFTLMNLRSQPIKICERYDSYTVVDWYSTRCT